MLDLKVQFLYPNLSDYYSLETVLSLQAIAA